MSADVSDGIARIQFPMVRVLAKNVVGPANFSRPVFVIPRTADRRHILKPGQFLVELVQFLQVSEFPRTAGAVQQKKSMRAIEASLFPFLGKGAHKAHKW